jgi:hypothetical protein
MPINTSRYKRSTEWASPKGTSRKPAFASAVDWQKRFYLLLILAVVLVVLLASALAFVLWKNRPAKTTDTTTTTTDTADISSWKKSENTSVNLTFLYPPDWKLTTNKNSTDLELLNVQITGSGTAGATATVKVDVIKDVSNVSLADWVKQFGPKDIETANASISGEAGLLAKFSNSDTGEEQNVYYVLKNSNVYVFDLYQSATDETLKKELADFAKNIAFSAVASSTPSATTTTPTSTTTSKVVINTVASSFDDEFSSYLGDGTSKKLLFSDKDASVYLKGSAESFTANGASTLVGYFGKSGSTSKDGVYSVALKIGSTPKEIVSGVTPGLVRVSKDGSTIGYLDGAKGVSKTIIMVDMSGTKVGTITSSKAIQYFALYENGGGGAYIPTNSGVPTFFSRDGVDQEPAGITLTSDNVIAFDMLSNKGETRTLYSFVYTVDTTSKLSTKTEMYYVKDWTSSSVAKKLTTDSAAQDNPRFNSDATKIAYQSYTSGVSGKSSVWVMGTDGKNDINIVKSGSNLLTGWISE